LLLRVAIPPLFADGGGRAIFDRYALADAIANNKRCSLNDIRLGFHELAEADAGAAELSGSKKAIEEAGAAMGRKVHVVLAPPGFT